VNHQKANALGRQRRKFRVRNHLKRSSTRPRLSVFRSRKHMHVQVIDDAQARTLVAASTVEKDYQGSGGNCKAAETLGKLIAERALAAGIKDVMFDRGDYRYHGRIAALAQAARAAGLNF
jgi:large subunit ribosomal protein L18